MTEITENAEDFGYVLDTLAVNEPRLHDVPLPNGLTKRYALKADEPTKMPIDHAMKFLCADSFVVTNGKGEQLKAIENLEHATNVQIPHGYVLAKFEELSREALVLRCKLLPGSEGIHPKKTSVTDMAAFLLAAQPKGPAGKDTSRELADKLFDQS